MAWLVGWRGDRAETGRFRRLSGDVVSVVIASLGRRRAYATVERLGPAGPARPSPAARRPPRWAYPIVAEGGQGMASGHTSAPSRLGVFGAFRA